MVQLMGKSGAVVVTLCKDLLNKGYKMYVDNWYSSEALFTYLHEHGTCTVGTIKKN